MVTLLTTSSSGSSRKAKQWLEDNNVDYKEIKLNKKENARWLTTDTLKHILTLTDYGFTDILSAHNKRVAELGDLGKFKTSELIETIVSNPSLLKYPIIYDHNRLAIGFNQSDIRMFIPREQRKQELNELLNEQ